MTPGGEGAWAWVAGALLRSEARDREPAGGHLAPRPHRSPDQDDRSETGFRELDAVDEQAIALGREVRGGAAGGRDEGLAGPVVADDLRQQIRPIVEIGLSATNSGSDIAVGETAIDFTLDDINGQSHSVSGSLGKPILILFWATW